MINSNPLYFIAEGIAISHLYWSHAYCPFFCLKLQHLLFNVVFSMASIVGIHTNIPTQNLARAADSLKMVQRETTVDFFLFLTKSWINCLQLKIAMTLLFFF
jgi:hypothetical protein